MPRSDFNGSWTALITPFNDDGSIDYEGLEKNVQFQVDQGITGILAVGTTGESPTLSNQEHIEVIAKAKKFAGEKCGILAGTGSNCTSEALDHCGHALESGINKVLLVDCYYNGPSSLELRDEYYRAILDEYREIEVVIYVIPGRTGTAILPVDIAVLAGEYDRVIAIKEATGDLSRMEEERGLMPQMNIMSGDDDKTCEMMTKSSISAQGVISVVTNIAPKAVTEMVDALRKGGSGEADTQALNLAKKLKPLFSIVTVKAKAERTLPDGKKIVVEDRFRNPLATKTLMNALGMPAGPSRRPMGKINREGLAVVRNAVKEVFENSSEILEPIAQFYGVDLEERITDDSYWKPLMYS